MGAVIAVLLAIVTVLLWRRRRYVYHPFRIAIFLALAPAGIATPCPPCHSSDVLTITITRSKRMSGSFDMDAPGYGMHQNGFCESTASDSFNAHAAMQATHIPTQRP